MTDLKKLLGNDSNMSYVTTFVKKTKRIPWTLKQDKKLEPAQGSLFNGYVAHERQGNSRLALREQNAQGNREGVTGDEARRIEGERNTYGRGDIRSWLITSSRDSGGTRQSGRERTEREGGEGEMGLGGTTGGARGRNSGR